LEAKSFMQAGYPKVVILILNWNGISETLECLRSIQKITYPNYIVLVVDNGSKGNDAEVINREFGDFVRVIKIKRNIGYTGGANVGIRSALSLGPNYVLLLNNDVVVDPNFLVELVNVSQNDAEIGIIGPKIYYYEQPNRIYSAGGRVNFWTGITPIFGAGEIDDGQFDAIEEVDYVGGAALLIKVETIKTIGLLTEIYFSYYEETDWCVKAKKAGFKVVYVPKAKIWHKSHDMKTNSAKALVIYYMTRNRIIFVKRNSSTLQFVVFNLYFLTTDFFFQMRYLSKSSRFFVAYLKGIFDGLRSFGHQ
jgi:GT2 family glycosyltransferase